MSTNRRISEWFYQYGDDVYNFLIYYTGSKDVEDLVQETFIKAIKACDTFQGNSSPKTWLYSIARNIAIDEQRKRKRRWMLSLPFMEKYEIKDEQTPEKIFETDEATTELYHSIKALKQTYQDVLILRGIEDLSVDNWNTQFINPYFGNEGGKRDKFFDHFVKVE